VAIDDHSRLAYTEVLPEETGPTTAGFLRRAVAWYAAQGIIVQRLLIAAGENIERLRSEAAFAQLCAAAPIPASSGKTVRHRLNPNGNREANRVLHMAVVVRMRYCATTQAYVRRRIVEGRSKREAMRCLKRFLARTLFRSLRADLTALPRGLAQARAA
jgi:transposase